MPSLKKAKFLYPYININNRREMAKGLKRFLDDNVGSFPLKEIRRAIDRGFNEYEKYMAGVRAENAR